MDPQEALNKLCTHLLGKDFYCISGSSNYTCNAEIVDNICGRYKAVDESPVDKWRRRHKRCYFCKHLRCLENPMGYDTFTCDAKGKTVNIDIPRPFCTVFELGKESNL